MVDIFFSFFFLTPCGSKVNGRKVFFFHLLTFQNKKKKKFKNYYLFFFQYCIYIFFFSMLKLVNNYIWNFALPVSCCISGQLFFCWCHGLFLFSVDGILFCFWTKLRFMFFFFFFKMMFFLNFNFFFFSNGIIQWISIWLRLRERIKNMVKEPKCKGFWFLTLLFCGVFFYNFLNVN